MTKLKGATPKTGKVAAQSRKAGAKSTAGAKVNLTLKPYDGRAAPTVLCRIRHRQRADGR